MNIKELLEEINNILGKEKLHEFAMPLKTLKAKIVDKTPIIFLHLYKIIGFGKEHPETINHWCAELSGFLGICNMKVKGNNKLLAPKVITNIMLEVYSNVKEFSSLGGELYSEYGYSKYKDSEIYNKLKEVLPNLISYIQQLKDDERVNIQEIKRLIS